jgi:hypothetical protein
LRLIENEPSGEILLSGFEGKTGTAQTDSIMIFALSDALLPVAFGDKHHFCVS